MGPTCLKPPPCAVSLRSGLVVKPTGRGRVLVLPSQSPLFPHLIRRAGRSSARIGCSFDNQVFEDSLDGIICYADENGEIICEGYDEGPRFRPKISLTTRLQHQDAKIIDMLHQNWIQIVKGSEVYQGLDVQLQTEEGFHCNGSIIFANE